MSERDWSVPLTSEEIVRFRQHRERQAKDNMPWAVLLERSEHAERQARYRARKRTA